MTVHGDVGANVMKERALQMKATESRWYTKSDPQDRLVEAVKSVFPGYDVKQDVKLSTVVTKAEASFKDIERRYGRPIGVLYCDVVVFDTAGKTKAVFEYHGEQHYRFTQHWHGDRSGYKEALDRDAKKAWAIEEAGIPFVVFSYKDDITPAEVESRYESAAIAASFKREHIIADVQCKKCKRMFSADEVVNGMCQRCHDTYEKLKERRREASRRYREKIKNAKKGAK